MLRPEDQQTQHRLDSDSVKLQVLLLSKLLAQATCRRHACLRAPWVLACAMRSLAIVITIVRSFSLFSLRLLLLTHFFLN